jgi:hypothetical protein
MIASCGLTTVQVAVGFVSIDVAVSIPADNLGRDGGGDGSANTGSNGTTPGRTEGRMSPTISLSPTVSGIW